MIKAIIFDLDGVLVEARELHYQALNKALEKFGYTISRDEHLSTYDGLPTKKKLELLTQTKGLPRDAHDAIWQEKQNQTRSIIKTEFKHDERMKGILGRLREEGYAIAVCSNSIKETAGLMLLHKGLSEYIEFFLSNEDVRFPKPHPEMFLRAMVELGVAPRETLIVEDSHHGREAAHASGAHVLGVTNTSDVTYEKIAKAIESAHGKRETAKFVPKWQGGELRVVIPMAGAGKKFLEAGFSFPKPLIDIKGKPMIQWVVENVNVDAKFVFIVLKEHLEKYNLNYLLKLIAPGCEIVALEEPTQGAALSVLAASHLFDHEHPLAIVNSDQVIDWNSNEFFYAMAADECHGGIVTFESTHPKWSFVKTGDDGFVAEVAEKKPISNQATAGVYYFQHGSDFVKYAKSMIDLNIRTLGEFYVCPVYNELLKEKKKVRAFPVKKVWSLGTPEDVHAFLDYHKDHD